MTEGSLSAWPGRQTRIGVLLEERAGAIDALAQLRAALGELELAGFDSAWLPHAFGFDALTALAAIGTGTKRLALGTAVVPIYPRHPVALAQQTLTAQAALGGRLRLGVGTSHERVVTGMHGLPFRRPARYAEQYLAVLRDLLRNGVSERSGDLLSANFALSAAAAHPTPILLAALGPKMLAVAGKLADGVVLFLTGPKAIRAHTVPCLEAAAGAAGREAAAVVSVIPVCVTDDPARARELAQRRFARYDTLPSYRSMLDLEGLARAGDAAVVGSEATVVDRLAAYVDAGVTEVVGAPFGTATERARALEALTQLAAPVP